jgi:hypothetical protein
MNKCAPRFQLVGRMTSCAELVAATGIEAGTSAAAPTTSGDSNRYFKSSWPEDYRVKERDVIGTAEARAKKLLPTGYQEFVVNHLPRVYEAGEVYISCTGIVRALLGLSTDESRTQYLMVSEKLSGLRHIVSDAEVFKKVYHEIIRGRVHFCPLVCWC